MQTNKWFSLTVFCFDCEFSLLGCSKSLPGSYFFISDLNPWPLVTSVCPILCAVFQTKTTSSQWLLSELFYDQISVSCAAHFSILLISIPLLLPYTQDTPKTVQDQQQQEQLKINTGFSWKSHGEVFIYNNSYFNLKCCPFFWHKWFWNLQLVGLLFWSGV